jgi:predicted alpha/beta superfamily hydrolase
MRGMLAVLRPFAGAACASAALGVAAAAQAPTPGPDSFPAVTLPGTQLRHLHSAATGRDYDIYVYLPTDYARNTAWRYPVLYLLDGQWDFKLLMSIQGGLLYDRFVPQVMVVGITYSGTNPDYNALRAADYTTAAVRNTPGSGGAPRFLAFLKNELIPFVESSYRTDPTRRALMGSSFGGLFTLYALFSDPGLFAGYVAGSPAVTFADRDAFAAEAAFAATHRQLPVRLFIAVGDQEALAAPVREFMGIVRGRSYGGLTLETRVIEGERHSGNKPEAFNRGLRFIFGVP